MSSTMKQVNSIDEYIALYPAAVQSILRQLRQVIRQAAPGAEEAIKYGIPTFILNGQNVVHFGAYQHHIGFYPAPRAIEVFKTELAAYEGGKGTVQFPLNQPIPFELVARIVEFRAKESAAKKTKNTP